MNNSSHFLPHSACCELLSAWVSIYSLTVGVTFCGLTDFHQLVAKDDGNDNLV